MQKLFASRERNILFLTIGVIIFSIIFNFLISPVLREMEILNNKTNALRIKLQKYRRLLNQKDYIEARLKKITSEANLSYEAKPALLSSLSQLQGLAKDAGIRIIDIRPQQAKRTNSYKETLIELRTEGNISGYFKFLYDIQNSLSILQIRKFQLNARANSETLDASFTISKLSLTE